jgi:hypothetical protein
MGLTNYQHALRKKYSRLTGELAELRDRIEQIEREQALLPDLQARAARLKALTASAAMLLQEEDAHWQEADSPPVRPWTHTLPIRFGSCGRRAMEVLREAERAMTVREITLEVLRRAGVTDPDRATLQRTQNAVDSSLRAHRGKGVESSDSYPAQWRCEGRPGVEFDL